LISDALDTETATTPDDTEAKDSSDPRFKILDDLLADVDLSMFQRRSKHAGGRIKPLTPKQRAKVKRARTRITQASKSATEDAKAVASAGE
jgi:ElaB/YqjD/DUF883 family membrane-anchored ribosome-binding protein